MQQWYYFCLLSTQKKRDCTVAVPHFEALVLPLYPNKQHRSPRRYVRIHARPLGTCDDSRIHIPRTSKCCNVLDTCEFTRFRNAKHKARWKPHKMSFTGDPFWRLIMSATTPPKRHNPKAWANYECKVSEKFAIVQEKSHFSVIFLVLGVMFNLIIHLGRYRNSACIVRLLSVYCAWIVRNWQEKSNRRLCHA